MLKHLLKRPAFWSLLALMGCVSWYMRPIDRSALFPVQFASGKYGYVNEDGRVVVRGLWDQAYSFAADGRALVGRDYEYGFIGRDGKLFAPLREEVSLWSNEPWRNTGFRWRGKTGKVSSSGQLMCSGDTQTPLWKYKPQKKGLRQNGKIIVDPVWDDIKPFDAANLSAVNMDGIWGFIDRTQKIVIPLEWDAAEPFAKNGLACVTKADRFGFINLAGKVVIPLEFHLAWSFHDNGLARVKKDQKVGFINRTGKFVIPLDYDDAAGFDHRNMSHVQIADRHGFIDATGASVIPLLWDRVGRFDDLPPPASSDMEIIDQDGQNHSVPVEKAKPASVKEGLARVEKNGRYGCINRQGELVVDPLWDSLSSFNDKGLANVSRNKKHGIINRKGEIIIAPEWDEVLDFDDKGMAVAQKGTKFGYIDAAGKILLPMDWDLLNDPAKNMDANDIIGIMESMRVLSRTAKFDSRDMAIVKRNHKYGFIDRSGKVILPLLWEDVFPFDGDDMAIAKRNGKYGFINRAGDIVVPVAWDTVTEFIKNHAKVTKAGKVGVINRKGEILVPAEWDGLAALNPSRESELEFFLAGLGHQHIDPVTPDILQAYRDKKSGYIDWTGKIIVAPEWESVAIRTDAGAEQCCFVVSRNANDGVQPGWMKSARDWLLGLIGRAEQRNVVCHLYATDGRLLWSSDWLSSTFWALALGVVAALILACDGIAIWRQRRRQRIAAITSAPSGTMK